MGARTIPVINGAAEGLAIPYADLPSDSGLGFERIGGADPGSAGAFAVIVTDDSMEPALAEGDYVVFAPADEPCARAVLEDGSVVFATFFDGLAAGRCTIARYYAWGGDVVLRKDNPRHRPVRVSRADIQRLAVAVERRTRLI